MAIIGICGVHATNPTASRARGPGHPGLRAIADAVHEHDMKLVTQIWHGGAIKPNVLGDRRGRQPVPIPTTGLVPQAMTKSMIDEMVEASPGCPAQKAAGLDGVEITVRTAI